MKKVYYLASCKELFVELRILTVPSLVIKHICSHVKKNIDTFLEQGTHSEYNLWNRKKLLHTDNQIQNFQVDLYNSLPVHIKDLSRKEFESQLNQFLIKNAFYSIDEYREFSQLQR